MGEKRKKQIELFEENMGLAKKIARDYAMSKGAPECIEECAQSAMEGLWIACLKFDPSDDIKFTTFAYKFCFGYARHGLIKFTRNERRNFARNDIKIEMFSGNVIVGQDKTTEIFELMEDKKQEDEINKYVEEYDIELFKNKCLEKREKKVLEYMLDGMLQCEIAVKIGVTSAMVNKIVKRIRSKYNKWIEGD